jgi:hypothetical protein
MYWYGGKLKKAPRVPNLAGLFSHKEGSDLVDDGLLIPSNSRIYSPKVPQPLMKIAKALNPQLKSSMP